MRLGKFSNLTRSICTGVNPIKDQGHIKVLVLDVKGSRQVFNLESILKNLFLIYFSCHFLQILHKFKLKVWKRIKTKFNTIERCKFQIKFFHVILKKDPIQEKTLFADTINVGNNGDKLKQT
jgi:hypothetical protein